MCMHIQYLYVCMVFWADNNQHSVNKLSHVLNMQIFSAIFTQLYIFSSNSLVSATVSTGVDLTHSHRLWLGLAQAQK